MNRRKAFIFIIILAIICLFTNILYYAVIMYGESKKRANRMLVADHIYEVMKPELDKPVTVAKMVASDEILKEFLYTETEYEKTDAVNHMQSYLAGFNDTLGFDTFFFVSEATKRYYTNNGLLKTIDPEGDSHDIWYSAFVSGESDIGVTVDKDQNNDNELTMFVNSKVYGEGNKLLGICGVGVSIKKMQTLQKQYEDSYDVSIYLTNPSGLIMVDDNDADIQKKYIDAGAFVKGGDMIYEDWGRDSYTVTGYLEDADWYLVIKKENEDLTLTDSDYIFTCMSIVAFFVSALSGILLLGRQEKGFTYKNDDNTKYDDLTGLPNRNYFKDIYGERGDFNTTIYKSLVVFDIDYFKEANDNQDGDDILCSVVNIAKECFGKKGEVFRWGGDEFMILLEWSVEFANEICREFCKKVEAGNRVTISMGLTEIRLAENVKKNYHRAVQGCYLVKEMGGNGVKRI
ncbi:MAG: GGDEF domain-containing protein [Lachnospiraceae bacterium]|nr:GGDEF domain-containing protein [Lachnospiraceae bacterium]